MTARQMDQVRAALASAPDDGRLARLGKLAALALIDSGAPVTRSKLAAASKEVDDDGCRAKRGFSEASLRTSRPLREIYELARTFVPKKSLRSRGHVSAHIMRMTKAQLATALVVGRLAAAEREEEHRLALQRLGEPFDTSEVIKARAVRSALPINDASRRPMASADIAAARTAVASVNAAAIGKARAWAKRHEVKVTAAWLADRCGLHPGTIERFAAREAMVRLNSRAFDFDVSVPAALLRHRKRDLGRALQVEREYIAALHAATMRIATIVIDREHHALRVAVMALR